MKNGRAALQWVLRLARETETRIDSIGISKRCFGTFLFGVGQLVGLGDTSLIVTTPESLSGLV